MVSQDERTKAKPTVYGDHCDTGGLEMISPMGNETVCGSPNDQFSLLGGGYKDWTDFEMA